MKRDPSQRMVLQKLPRPPTDERHRSRPHMADRERCASLQCRLNLGAQVGLLDEQSPSLVEQDLSGSSQAQSPTISSIDEANSQLKFQSLELLSQRRLTQVQLVRRRGETHRFGDGHKALDIS